MSESVLPIFSSRSFMLFSFIFTSFLHFQFIFIFGVRECSNFTHLHVAVQFCSITYWNNCLFSIGYSCLLYYNLIDYKYVDHGVVLYVVLSAINSVKYYLIIWHSSLLSLLPYLTANSMPNQVSSFPSALEAISLLILSFLKNLRHLHLKLKAK